MEEQKPFDLVGVLVTCHGQQLCIGTSSPGVCLACHGVITIAELKMGYQRPSMIATPQGNIPPLH